MKRRWKIALGVMVSLAVLLVVNAVTTSNGTREAEVTVEGGEVLQLSRAALQVVDTGEPATETPGQPIVLLHCYSCSTHYFDRLAPLLAENHRVVAIDLPGHGGSEAPESGYEIPEQAAAVAEALNALDIQGALVAGNSMGGAVTTSLAEQASQLVDRAALIGMAPSVDSYGRGLPFVARLGYVPVIGEALWRVSPDAVVRSGTGKAFPPGFDTAAGFEDPDQPVLDFRRLTYSAFDSASAAVDEYTEESTLAERFQATPVPLMVIFGSEDQIFDDPEAALAGFEGVPGVRTELLEGAGHTPQVDAPEEVAALLESFAAPPEPAVASKPKRKRRAEPKPRASKRERRSRGAMAPGERRSVDRGRRG